MRRITLIFAMVAALTGTNNSTLVQTADAAQYQNKTAVTTSVATTVKDSESKKVNSGSWMRPVVDLDMSDIDCGEIILR